MIKTVHFENGSEVSSDVYVINADQARFETAMLLPEYQTYPKQFRDKKTFAPSGFIIYAGIDKQLPHLEHHNLYFNEDRDQSFGDIFDRKVLPDDPSLYICAPSKTDPHVAPDGKENLFILVPIPNGITISPEQKSSYRDQIRKQVEHMAGESIVDHLVYEKIFVVDDFEQRYNARQGTALGLAHKMSQTASFRPNNYSKKLNNLFYV
jgi:phytoene dehydrogenase-like protein